ncbi:hypothetical protein AB0D62_00020 [Streptomyces massasporeus]|uniref:hypothetical protein n=1 Tax=Streptomyces massasporeus TaxID=67324 RepID=UPI0033FAA6E1
MSVLALHRIPSLDQPENQAEEKLREEGSHPEPPQQEAWETLTNSARRGVQLGELDLDQSLLVDLSVHLYRIPRSTCRSVSGEVR